MNEAETREFITRQFGLGRPGHPSLRSTQLTHGQSTTISGSFSRSARAAASPVWRFTSKFVNPEVTSWRLSTECSNSVCSK